MEGGTVMWSVGGVGADVDTAKLAVELPPPPVLSMAALFGLVPQSCLMGTPALIVSQEGSLEGSVTEVFKASLLLL